MVALEYINICDIYRYVMVWWLLHHSILDGIETLALPFLKDSYKSRRVLWRRQEMGRLPGKSSPAVPRLGVCLSVLRCRVLTSPLWYPALRIPSSVSLTRGDSQLVLPAFALPVM